MINTIKRKLIKEKLSEVVRLMETLIAIRAKGGPGSGNFNHFGRQGKVGGSGKQPVGDDGLYIPGAVGGSLGVNTSKWKKTHPSTQWALKKIHKLEEYAEKGEWDKVQASLYSTKSAKPNTYQKGVLAAQEALLKKHKEGVKSIPDGATAGQKPGTVAKDGWTKISGKMGTEEGGLYTFQGKKYYVKTPADVNRARNELLALKLYEAAGGSAKKGMMIDLDGKEALATEWIEEANKVSWDTNASKALAADDFAIHAWLANHDAVGAGAENPMDNIRFLPDDGKMIMLDAGGALEYKGMGGSGKKQWDDSGSEIYTMRDPSKNPSAAKVFGGMTPQQVAASANKLNNLTDDDIRGLCNTYGPGTKSERIALADKLISRRNGILKYKDGLESGIKQMQKSESVASDNGSKPTSPKIPSPAPSVPPPPYITAKSWSHLNTKYEAIHEAAKKGDVAAIEKIKANPNSKNHYTASLAKYKAEVLATMGAGGKVSEVTTSAAEVKKPKAAKITISEKDLPTPPTFYSPTYKQANDLTAKALHELAMNGDIEGLKASDVGKSGKLQAFQKQLITTVAMKLNPPPPPKALDESYDEVIKKLKNPKTSKGVKKIGYWTVHDDLGGTPSGIPKDGKWNGGLDDSELFTKGKNLISDLNDHVLSGNITYYTGGGYHDINKTMRTGKPTSKSPGSVIGKAIIDKGMDLPVGMMLSRKHDVDSDSLLSEIKVGQVVADKGVLSTSTNPEVWSGKAEWKMTVGPGVKGLPVDYVSSSPGEKEVLLPPNQRLLVTKVEHKTSSWGNKYTEVHATILPTDSGQCCPP